MKIAIIGGGAAGFFSALVAKEANPEAEVFLIERGAQLLTKVRISGGGRCNVTHSCFDPKELTQHYPRGAKELIGPFHRFQPQDTISWFQERGVRLKTEGDGRMFPVSDSSNTIINCFLEEAERLGIHIKTRTKLESIKKKSTGFELTPLHGSPFTVDRLILATGSGRGGWDFARALGHTTQSPVPSLFTFNVPSFPLKPLLGVSTRARLKLEGSRLMQEGPLLITHWGFSGPAALKLSAYGARYLAEKNYEVTLQIDWVPHLSEEQLFREEQSSKQLGNFRIDPLPKKLWKALCTRAGLSTEAPFNSLGKGAISRLCETLKRDRYKVKGKTTNKEEFVTCGGITLSEVDFRRMESRCCPNLFFCGEILDIDGVTGGFNFQNAWTTGWLAGRAASLVDE